MDRDGALLRLELPDRSEAPRAARKALTALNGSLGLISAARLRDVQLVAGELVANAVRHGGRTGAAVTLTVHANPEVMRVEVRDEGEGFDPAQLVAPSSQRGGGWGLPLVAALADRWGVQGSGPTTVWFEIDRPRRRSPLAADVVAAR